MRVNEKIERITPDTLICGIDSDASINIEEKEILMYFKELYGTN